MKAPVKLTADLIESFGGAFLSPIYDSPHPTPEFHREVWEYYCRDIQCAAVAAPRLHAKSTAFTHVFGLAVMLFRAQQYAIVIGSSEELAIEHLGDIANELRDNDELRIEFGIRRLVVDSKTDIICEMDDGYQFRMIARGGEQKIRGKKWMGKRPGLILMDDAEDDEQVENRDRRRKFSKWFFRAAKQALREGGIIRAHGTILHEDSLLANLIKIWKGKLFKAHAGFDDFTEILWPEAWTEKRLRATRQEFIDAQDAAGYSQEYLNDPLDNSDAFLRAEDFVSMDRESGDYNRPKIICASADFAVSKKDKANRTSFDVGGRDIENVLHFLDNRCGRWDPVEWIEEMFSIQKAWNPDIFWVEDGVIWKSVSAMVYAEMRRRNRFINIVAIPSVTDKASRGRSLQRRMRARGTRWDTESTWFAGKKDEMLRFTGVSEATLDDHFDSAALLSRGFDDFMIGEEEEDYQEDDDVFHRFQSDALRRQSNRNQTTGY